MNKTTEYQGFFIIPMHNPSGKLKYYIGNENETSNQEWPTIKAAEKVIRTICELA